MAAIDLKGRATLVVEKERAQVVTTLSDMLEVSRRSAEEAALKRQEADITESLAEPARMPVSDLEAGVSLRPQMRPEPDAPQPTTPLEQAIPTPSPISVEELPVADPETGQPIQSTADVVSNEVQQGLMSRTTPSDIDTSNKGMSFLTFIAKGEGGYESSNRGTKNNKIQGSTHSTTRDDKKLSEMTIDDIRAKMKIKNPDNPDRLFAVGKYQLIPSTFEMAVKATGLSGDTVFNPETQEKIGQYLLFKKRPALGAYIKGESNDIDKALLEAAKEWASLPVPSGPKKGNSYHGKGNKAQHTLNETIIALNEARNAYIGQ